jgi:cation-transporting ATPase E
MQTFEGLTSAQVRERAAKGLTNLVRKETSRTYSGIVWSNLFNVFNIAVFSMAGVLLALFAYTGDRRTLYDAVAISTVAFLNTIISIIQEIRAKIALDRIIALSKPTADVIRDGKEVEIPAEEIVVDEVIKLKRGDQIPVDGRMLFSHHCEVDESLLTGESVYIEKEEGDEVLSGSFCAAGHGVMVAERVGEDAYIHRLTREVRAYKRFVTPLQHHIDQLVKILMATAAVMAFLVVCAALAKHRLGPAPGSELAAVIETTRSVASIMTSMVPVGLILLATVAFALGIFRISRRGALVQKLNAIESFANVDTLCMDKTGTLTKNELKVERLTPLGAADEPELGLLVAAFAHHSSEKNATAVALEKRFPRPEARVLDEIPFNSREKFSAVSLEIQGRCRHLFFGASEKLGPRFSQAEREAVQAVIVAHPGLRHLVLGELPQLRTSLQEDFAQGASLHCLGVVSLIDEVRPDVRQVLQGFADRGIALKIVSGDAPETVQAVARAAGWTQDTSRVVTGPQLDQMTPEAVATAAATCSLFARVSPKNKQDLVSSLQKQGKYVAMVGDGVNDVLALKKAELGVAMGAGNRMSRDVSDIVLLQNDFAILPQVLEEGTTILGNVQSAAKLFLTKNMYAVALILAAGFVGLAFPFVPRHVTIIGFFAISIPALLITFTRRIQDIPPSFLRDVLRFTGISGGCIALAALSSFFISLVGFRSGVEQARTVMLTQIVLLSLLNFLIIVGGSRMLENLKRNWGMTLFAAGFALLYLVSLFLVTHPDAPPILREFLEIRSLSAIELGLTFALTAVTGAAMVLLHRWVARRA